MKVLLVRLSSAGDILLTADTIKALQAEGIETHLLVKPAFEKIAQLIKPDSIKLYKGFGTIKQLNAEKYDCVIDLHDTLRSFFITLFVKAQTVKKYKKESIRRRLLVLFKWSGGEFRPVSEKYLEAACQAAGKKLKVPAEKRKPVKKIRNILLHAGARWQLKRWPYMEELAKQLLAQGYNVTVTGVKDEVENSGSLLYISGKGLINKIGKTDLTGLFRLISQCDCFIGNDTMAAHAAAFFGKPALVFMGPTVCQFGFVNSGRFTLLERELACRPCGLHGKGTCATGTFECMRGIQPQDVIGKLKKLTLQDAG